VRHTQIILRLYKSPAEILMGFDVDSCCVGYDGRDVFVLPRARRALTKRYNLVDLSRRSLTYETRLYKYAKRGFAVAVPGLLRHLVDPEVYLRRPWQVKGLAKLVLFEHCLTNPEGRYDAWRPKGHRLRAYRRDEYSEDRIHHYQQVDQWLEERRKEEKEEWEQEKEERRVEREKKKIERGAEGNEEEEGEEEEEEEDDWEEWNHDYSNVFLPWGPQWYTQQIVKELVHRDKAQWATTGYHICFVGIEGMIFISVVKKICSDF
jgi:hypothetical protein